MKHRLILPMVVALAASLGLSTAQAGYQGGASAPPLLLSPDLTEPWVLQLQPQRRSASTIITTRPLPQAYAPRRAAPPQANTRPSAQQASLRSPAPARRAARAIDPRFLPTTVAYNGRQKPGTIVIDTKSRYLYLVGHDGFARRYGVGVGRAGFGWKGTQKITRKAEWPDWRPPAQMRKRQPGLPAFVAGGPNNPLGARALYLGSTLYRIHGSNEPWTIGKAVSSGCIRMRNEDVVDLYNRVKIGAKVIVR